MSIFRNLVKKVADVHSMMYQGHIELEYPVCNAKEVERKNLTT